MYQLWAWWIHTDYLAGDQVCKLAHSLFEFVQDGQWFRSCCRFCCRFCCNIDSLLTLRIYRAANELHTAEHIDVTRKQHAKVFQVHVIRETVLGSLLLPFHLWAAVGVEVEMLEVLGLEGHQLQTYQLRRSILHLKWVVSLRLHTGQRITYNKTLDCQNILILWRVQEGKCWSEYHVDFKHCTLWRTYSTQTPWPVDKLL